MVRIPSGLAIGVTACDVAVGWSGVIIAPSAWRHAGECERR
jgi:hypothetical protein